MIEFAVCLPVLVLVIVGSIEVCNTIFLKQALTEAAYQGALVAMKPDATEPDINARINTVLTARSINAWQINVANNDFASVNSGDTFVISVSADSPANQLFSMVITNLSSVVAAVTLVKQ